MLKFARWHSSSELTELTTQGRRPKAGGRPDNKSPYQLWGPRVPWPTGRGCRKSFAANFVSCSFCQRSDSDNKAWADSIQQCTWKAMEGTRGNTWYCFTQKVIYSLTLFNNQPFTKIHAVYWCRQCTLVAVRHCNLEMTEGNIYHFRTLLSLFQI